MKALTDEDFQAFLDEEVSWRRSELNLLKFEVGDAARSPQSPQARARTRALCVMTYAHWEGYIKTSFDKLAESVSRRRPLLRSASDEFVVSHLQHAILRISSGDASAKGDLLQIVRGTNNPRLRLRRDALVKTHDNLRYTYFCEILEGFGLSAEEFELSKNFIDSAVCDRRNIVAHGRESFPSPADAIEAVDKVLQMIVAVRDLQLQFLTGRKYLKGEAGETASAG